MSASCAIYLPSTDLKLKTNPFGKDVANLALYRAFARYLPGEELWFLVHQRVDDRELGRQLFPAGGVDKRIRATSILDFDAISDVGTLFRGKADLADLAWARRQTGERRYSLAGLIHSMAPPAMRDYMAKALVAPVQPWDAMVCTSPSVVDGMTAMLENWADYLNARLGGRRRPLPKLPLIPLAVDLEAIERRLSEPGLRAGWRQRLGIAAEDIAALWLGRLSYFEKAFPQPMFQALEEAARRTHKRVHFIMAGWFAGGDRARALYEEAARIHGPSLTVHYLDGNDRRVVDTVWSAVDVFISLVDNIQETFGIAPIEAMGAGLPVVVSDWDGYRFTVRHEADGFRIPTLVSAPGSGTLMSLRHVLGMDAYQAYVGNLAQHTAVDIGAAVEALSALFADPELRVRMGRSGRERVRTTFDWPVVVGQYADLFTELAEIRAKEAPYEDATAAGAVLFNPVKGEPFTDFASFATNTLSDGTVLRLREGVDAGRLEEVKSAALNSYMKQWRSVAAADRQVLERLRAEGPLTVAELLGGVPESRREQLARLLVWMSKVGLLGWKSAGPAK